MPSLNDENATGSGQVVSGLAVNPMKLFDLAKSQGRVLYCAAPMVRYSKLAFRQTVARYGVDLTWTPMILAKEFNRSILARDSDSSPSQNQLTTPSPDFTTSPAPTPTLAQLGVNSPLEIRRTTQLLAPHINGIDINCGCPQSWACAETLGAALMQHPTLVSEMVTTAKSTLHELGYEGKKTISVKIRVHKDLRQTLDFVRQVEDAGVDFITVHGRLRHTRSSEPVNLDAIKLVKEHARVPVIANGDVFSLSDVDRIVKHTGVDGVMSARGLLECPGEREGTEDNRWEVLEFFMNSVMRAPIPFKLVVHHLSEMVGSDRSQSGRGTTLFTKEERAGLMECKSLLEVIDFVDGVREVRRFE
ncbi:tRNA-dihydrouridine synthase-like protein 4-like protein [Rhexocercosporidium sp. MPI-PUGE-AT-0058]|nr:tRNA-dihydrouridine synthase-like protein 4-like protein [Rhexocercosporidium sp. MPI-PUGE-AT-0058]